MNQLQKTIEFYRERGYPVEKFDKLYDKYWPIRTFRCKKLPVFEYANETVKFDFKSRFFSALKREMKRKFYVSYVSHCDSFLNGICRVKKIDYITRSIFVLGMDTRLPEFEKTLREIILPHPFDEKGAEGLNEYPFVKSIGSHVLLKNGNTYYFQIRSELGSYAGMIDPTAGGAVDWGRDPVSTIHSELVEEVGITKIKNLKYLGRMLNYDLLLDVTFLFVAETDKVPKNSSEVKEILEIEARPEELLDEMKSYLIKLTPNVIGILKLLS